MGELTVKTAARLAGLSEHTLRAWERRYSAVTPKRTASGRRAYNIRDLERLKTLHELVDRGYWISRIARKPITDLRKLLIESDASSGTRFKRSAPDLNRNRVVLPEEDSYLRAGYKNVRERIFFSLKNFQLKEINDELIYARTQYNPSIFILKVLSPLFKELGSLVAKGSFRIAHEHVLSAIIRQHIHQLLPTKNQPFIRRPVPTQLVLSTPGGELHEFGVLLGAAMCAHYHIPHYYLGPSLPAKELAHVATTLKATAVVLGTSTISEGLLVEPLDDYLRHLDQKLHFPCEIWWGGEGLLKKSAFKLKHRLRIFTTLDQLDQTLLNSSNA